MSRLIRVGATSVPDLSYALFLASTSSAPLPTDYRRVTYQPQPVQGIWFVVVHLSLLHPMAHMTTTSSSTVSPRSAIPSVLHPAHSQDDTASLVVSHPR